MAVNLPPRPRQWPPQEDPALRQPVAPVVPQAAAQPQVLPVDAGDPNISWGQTSILGKSYPTAMRTPGSDRPTLTGTDRVAGPDVSFAGVLKPALQTADEAAFEETGRIEGLTATEPRPAPDYGWLSSDREFMERMKLEAENTPGPVAAFMANAGRAFSNVLTDVGKGLAVNYTTASVAMGVNKRTSAIENAGAILDAMKAAGQSNQALEADLANQIAELRGEIQELRRVRVQDNPVYSASDYIEDLVDETLPDTSAYANSFLVETVPSAIGSVAGIGAVMVATSLATGGSGSAVLLSGMATGAMSAAGSEFDLAKLRGASEEDARRVATRMQAMGMTDAIPLFQRFAVASRLGGPFLVRFLARMADRAMPEAAQEAAYTLVSNWLHIREYGGGGISVTEGVGRDAAAGAVAGILFGGSARPGRLEEARGEKRPQVGATSAVLPADVSAAATPEQRPAEPKLLPPPEAGAAAQPEPAPPPEGGGSASAEAVDEQARLQDEQDAAAIAAVIQQNLDTEDPDVAPNLAELNAPVVTETAVQYAEDGTASVVPVSPVQEVQEDDVLSADDERAELERQIAEQTSVLKRYRAVQQALREKFASALAIDPTESVAGRALKAVYGRSSDTAFGADLFNRLADYMDARAEARRAVMAAYQARLEAVDTTMAGKPPSEVEAIRRDLRRNAEELRDAAIAASQAASWFRNIRSATDVRRVYTVDDVLSVLPLDDLPLIAALRGGDVERARKVLDQRLQARQRVAKAALATSEQAADKMAEGVAAGDALAGETQRRKIGRAEAFRIDAERPVGVVTPSVRARTAADMFVDPATGQLLPGLTDEQKKQREEAIQKEREEEERRVWGSASGGSTLDRRREFVDFDSTDDIEPGEPLPRSSLEDLAVEEEARRKEQERGPEAKMSLAEIAESRAKEAVQVAEKNLERTKAKAAANAKKRAKKVAMAEKAKGAAPSGPPPEVEAERAGIRARIARLEKRADLLARMQKRASEKAASRVTDARRRLNKATADLADLEATLGKGKVTRMTAKRRLLLARREAAQRELEEARAAYAAYSDMLKEGPLPPSARQKRLMASLRSARSAIVRLRERLTELADLYPVAKAFDPAKDEALDRFLIAKAEKDLDTARRDYARAAARLAEERERQKQARVRLAFKKMISRTSLEQMEQELGISIPEEVRAQFDLTGKQTSPSQRFKPSLYDKLTQLRDDNPPMFRHIQALALAAIGRRVTLKRQIAVLARKTRRGEEAALVRNRKTPPERAFVEGAYPNIVGIKKEPSGKHRVVRAKPLYITNDRVPVYRASDVSFVPGLYLSFEYGNSVKVENPEAISVIVAALYDAGVATDTGQAGINAAVAMAQEIVRVTTMGRIKKRGSTGAQRKAADKEARGRFLDLARNALTPAQFSLLDAYIAHTARKDGLTKDQAAARIAESARKIVDGASVAAKDLNLDAPVDKKTLEEAQEELSNELQAAAREAEEAAEEVAAEIEAEARADAEAGSRVDRDVPDDAEETVEREEQQKVLDSIEQVGESQFEAIIDGEPVVVDANDPEAAEQLIMAILDATAPPSGNAERSSSRLEEKIAWLTDFYDTVIAAYDAFAAGFEAADTDFVTINGTRQALVRVPVPEPIQNLAKGARIVNDLSTPLFRVFSKTEERPTIEDMKLQIGAELRYVVSEIARLTNSLNKAKEALDKPRNVKTRQKLSDKLNKKIAERLDSIIRERTENLAGKMGKPGNAAAAVPLQEREVADPGANVAMPSTLPEPAKSSWLTEAQRKGIALAYHAWKTNKRGFQIADGTGFGKSGQLAAIAAAIADDLKNTAGSRHKVTIVYPGEAVDNEIQRKILRDALSIGKSVHETLLDTSRVRMVSAVELFNMNGPQLEELLADTAALLVDEAQGWIRGEITQGKKSGLSAAQKSVAAAVNRANIPFHVYASATPANSVDQLPYLFKRLDPDAGSPGVELLFNQDVARIHTALTKAKAKAAAGSKTGEAQYAAALAEATGFTRKWAMRWINAGTMISRENASSADTLVSKLTDEETRAGLKPFGEEYTVLPPETAEAVETEYVKLNHALRLVKESIAQGRSVIVSFNRVTAPKGVPAGKSAPIFEFQRMLSREGIFDVSIITGMSNKQDEVRKFQSNTNRVMLLTDAGAAGIDLDDQVGDRPRDLIVLKTARTGESALQLVGRHDRASTKSRPRTIVVAAPTLYDRAWRFDLQAKIAIQRAVAARLEVPWSRLEEHPEFLARGDTGKGALRGFLGGNALYARHVRQLTEEYVDLRYRPGESGFVTQSDALANLVTGMGFTPVAGASNQYIPVSGPLFEITQAVAKAMRENPVEVVFYTDPVSAAQYLNADPDPDSAANVRAISVLTGNYGLTALNPRSSDPKSKVFVNLSKAQSPNDVAVTLLHELVHVYAGITVAEFNEPEIRRMMAAVGRQFGDTLSSTEDYYMTSPLEFITGALSDPTFMQKLQTVRMPGSKLKTLWRALVDLFRRALGLRNDEETLNVLDRVMQITPIYNYDRYSAEYAEAREMLASQMVFRGDGAVETFDTAKASYLSDLVQSGTSTMSQIGDKAFSAMLTTMQLSQIAESFSSLTPAVDTPTQTNLIKEYLNAEEERANLTNQAMDKFQDRVIRPLRAFNLGAGKQKVSFMLNGRKVTMYRGQLLSTLMNMSGVGGVHFGQPADAASNRRLGIYMSDKQLRDKAEAEVKGKTWIPPKVHPGAKAIWATWKPLFDTALGEEGRKVYNDIAKFFEGEQQRTYQSAVGAVLDILTPLPDGSWAERPRPEITAKVNELMEKPGVELAALGVTAERLADLKRVLAPGVVPGAYFPLRRFGDYVVVTDVVRKFSSEAERDRLLREFPGATLVYRDAAGNPLDRSNMKPGDDVPPSNAIRYLSVSRFETIAEAERFREEEIEAMRELGLSEKDALAAVSGVQLADDAVVPRGSPISSAILNAIDTRLESLGSSGTEKTRLVNLIKQAVLDATPDSSLASLLRARKGWPGASLDLERVMHAHSSVAAFSQASLRTAAKRRSLASHLRWYASKKARREAAGDASARGGRMLQLVTRELFKRQQMAEEAMRMPAWGRTMTNVGFAYYLLGSSYMMLNMMQVPALTGPHLSARHGMAATVGALQRAYRTIGAVPAGKLLRTGGSVTALKGLFAGKDFDTANYDVIDDILGATDDPNIKKLLRLMTNKGLIDTSLLMDAVAHSHRRHVDGHGRAVRQGVFSYVSEWMRMGPHLVEVMNRSVTAVAAFNLEYERLKRRNPELPEKAVFDKAAEYAADAVYTTQFNYAGWNRARILRPMWARVALMFMQYPQAIYYYYLSRAITSTRGLKKMITGVPMTPEERQQAAEAAKALTYVAGFHVLAGGIYGGMFEPVKWLVGALGYAFGDDDEPMDIELELRQTMTELLGPKWSKVAVNGLPNLVGVDLSRRMGVQNLLFYDTPDVSSADRLWAHIARQATGPMGGLAERVYDMTVAVSRGDYYRAAVAATPKVIGDPLKAIWRSREGFVDMAGRQYAPPDAQSALDHFITSIGFTPSSLTDIQLARRVGVYDQRMMQARSRVINGYIRRILGGRDTGSAIEEIREWNRRNPDYAITSDTLKRSLRNNLRQQGRTEQYVYVPESRRAAIDRRLNFVTEE